MHELFQQECVHLLDQSRQRIEHCIGQLNHKQLWWQPGEDQNSIGVILRHVTGNLQQWAVDGVAESANQRDRDAEFQSLQRETAEQLLGHFTDTVDRASRVITELPADMLTASRTIQGFQVSVVSALMHTIPHLVGHTHQIVTLTRQQLGKDYRFHWNPAAERRKVPL